MVYGIVYVSVPSKLDLRNSRERERVSGELQSVVQFPAFARERLNPGVKPFLPYLTLGGGGHTFELAAQDLSEPLGLSVAGH